MRKEYIFNEARQTNRTYLTEIESKDLIREAGIPVLDTRLAGTEEEAVSLSIGMGFPAVLKIVSPDIIHKTECGGVKLDLKNVEEVSNAYRQICSSVAKHYPKSSIVGVSVQKMAPLGTEVIIGTTKDAQFGPVVMFGLGGILVELLHDVAFRIVPLIREDVQDMIKEIKGYRLLEGYRGREGVSISALGSIILQVSDFVDRTPEVRELDLNPIFAYTEGAIAVDARIILEPW